MATSVPSVALSLKAGDSTPPSRASNLKIQHVILGDVLFKTWYPSYYPEELVGRDLDRLYVCQWCFKYCPDLVPFLAHRKLCHARGASPPGQLIYSRDDYAIYEVDGEEHQLFSQNLSLFAKLFLDNKSVFFDVASFDFYLLVRNPPPPPPPPHGPVAASQPQIIGFFSKEKMSWDNNNLACILIFPPWQRKGLGKILMGISYELSRLEERIGGPEKPMSELGRMGYLKFWQARVASAILGMRNKSTVRVEEIAAVCWMLPEDVMMTLQEMHVLATRKKNDASLVISKARVREWLSVSKVDLTPPVDEAGFADGYLVDVEE